MQKWNTIFSEEKGLISNYVILENPKGKQIEGLSRIISIVNNSNLI